MARPIKDVSQLAEQCRKVPQKLMLQLFGAKEKETLVLKRFEQAWDFPVGSTETNLFAVFKSLRAFFHKHGPVIREIIKSSDINPALATRLHQAKVRKVEGEAEATELRNNQKAHVTCDVKLMHEFLARLSERYQSAAQQAQRQWGNDGFEIFNALQTSLREDLGQTFGEPAPTASKQVILTPRKKSRRSKK